MRRLPPSGLVPSPAAVGEAAGMIVELAKLLGLLLALSLMQGFVRRRWAPRERTGQLVSGLLFGLICVVGMMAPVVIADGLIFDPRSVVLAAAGLFGGPVTGLVAATLAGGYRVWMGGVGMPVGLAVIASSVLFGLAYRVLHRRGHLAIALWPLLGFGVALHLWVVLLFYVLLPQPVVGDVVDSLMLPFVLIFAPGTALLGMLLKSVETQIETAVNLETSEERFRQMAETIREVFWITDPDKNEMTYISPGYEDIWGRSRESLYREPLTFLDAIHDEDRDRVIAALPSQVHGAYDTEYRITQPDGAERWIRDRAFPVADDQGRVYRVVGLAQDITERKHAEIAREEALAVARRMEAVALDLSDRLGRELENAEAANLAKSRFLANISHELRTPLNAIIGFAETMKLETFGPMSARYREYAGDIHVSAGHLLSLINDLLDITAIEDDRRRLSPVRMTPRQAVHDAVTAVKPLLRDGGLSLRLSNPRDLPAIVADRRALHQCLINLLSNAIKFTRKGGRIAIASRATGDGFVELVVSDTGIGIPGDRLAAIGQPFEQVGDLLTAQTKGTGLGLAITRKLAEAMGGAFRIDSALGEGTRATLRLPVDEGMAAAVEAARAAGP